MEILLGIGVVIIGMLLLSYGGYVGDRGSTIRAGSSFIAGMIILGYGICGTFNIELDKENHFVLIVLLTNNFIASIAITIYGGRLISKIKNR